MDVRAARQDLREAHLNGPGRLKSGVVWLAVAALASRGIERTSGA